MQKIVNKALCDLCFLRKRTSNYYTTLGFISIRRMYGLNTHRHRQRKYKTNHNRVTYIHIYDSLKKGIIIKINKTIEGFSYLTLTSVTTSTPPIISFFVVRQFAESIHYTLHQLMNDDFLRRLPSVKPYATHVVNGNV